MTEITSWNYCPGSFNPADIPSRGLLVSEFLSKEMWWKGLKFITQTDVELPTPPVLDCSREVELEQLNKVPDVTHTLYASWVRKLTVSYTVV